MYILYWPNFLTPHFYFFFYLENFNFNFWVVATIDFFLKCSTHPCKCVRNVSFLFSTLKWMTQCLKFYIFQSLHPFSPCSIIPTISHLTIFFILIYSTKTYEMCIIMYVYFFYFFLHFSPFLLFIKLYPVIIEKKNEFSVSRQCYS